jgi:hypothetical protein
MRHTQVLPLLSSLVIVTFAMLVFRRYRRHGGAHLLLWGLGLTMFAAASVSEAYSARAWHPAAFRLWYLCGAVYTAAWLGQGTVFLLSPQRRPAVVSAVVLAGGSLIAGYFVLAAPLNAAVFDAQRSLSAQYQRILPEGATVRKLTPVFNIYGTLTLVGGALYSAWLLWRRATVPHRVVGNVLIAAGGLFLALAGTLVRLGWADFLYVAELLAAVSMFAGFLLASVPGRRPSAVVGSELT